MMGSWSNDGLPYTTEVDVRGSRDGAATRARNPSAGLDRIAAMNSWRASFWQIRIQITAGIDELVTGPRESLANDESAQEAGVVSTRGA